jgi:hypothetical protein
MAEVIREVYHLGVVLCLLIVVWRLIPKQRR